MIATMLGKVLILLNLALSLMMMAVAAGIYTNRIDWQGATKTPGETLQGVFDQKKAEYLKWADPNTGLIYLARARWQPVRDALVFLEKRRTADRAWYAEKLAGPETKEPVLVISPNEGKDIKVVIKDGQMQLATAQGQARVLYVNPLDVKVVVEKSGVLEIYAPSLPVMAESTPALLPRKSYQDSLEDLDNKIKEQTKAVVDLIAQEKDLTRQIEGEKDKSRGLRELIRLEKITQQNAVAEREDYVKPLRITREEEGQLLTQRKKSLQERLKELQAVVAAR